MNQPKVRDLSQVGDGLSGHTSSISKAPAPESACIPGNDGLAEVSFASACGDGEVRNVSTATKSVGSTMQQPTTARPNDKPQQVQCPTYNPDKGSITKAAAVYNGSNSGRFGSF